MIPYMYASKKDIYIKTALMDSCRKDACFWAVKKTAWGAAFFREGISFLWGIAKNYIMYWGGLQVV